MRYKVFATDYDNTLARNEQVSAETIRLLQELKASGRICILVTGRELKDLLRVFPQYELFDRIVAENGALIYRPDTAEEKVLAEPPPMSFIKELQLAGVQPLSVGKVIIATWEPHQLQVLETIKKAGIERQVIFNKSAVMILPPGINKATGLQAALQEMNLSYHNVVAIGDAENDSHLLQMSECGIAVSDALPALKQLADWTTTSPCDEGVRELIGSLLRDDLKELDPVLKRHHLNLGLYPDGTPFKLSPYGQAVLVTGPSMSGKTTLAAAFLEDLLDRKYQFCLIDPEGDYHDYEGHPGVVKIGDADHAPEMASVAALLKNPLQSCVVCLIAIPFPERGNFFKQLTELLLLELQQLGHPHWLILDEVHHLFGQEQHAGAEITGQFKNLMMMTTSPDLVSPVLLRQAKMVMVLGEHPQVALQAFVRLTGLQLPEIVPEIAGLKGQALVWDLQEDKPPFLVETIQPMLHLQRHKRKYAKGDLKEKSFYFTGPKGLWLRAKNLIDFLRIAETIDETTWLYHLHRHDYSNWFDDAISDEELANAVRVAETTAEQPGQSKEIIRKLIENNYTGPVE